MKKVAILSLIPVIAILFTACGNSVDTSNQGITKGVITAETSITTVSITEEPTLTEHIATTNFIIETSETYSCFDEQLMNIVENNNVSVTNSNGQISFSATQNVMSKIAKEYKDTLEEIAANTNSDSSIQRISIDDNYETVSFYVNDKFSESLDSIGILLYTHPMTELQMLNGISENDVRYTQKIINNDTQEIIGEAVFPDDLNN